ncbi:MAG TPA: MBL fold metallo-hydrolase [Cyclobacteriaceae bacterium]
MSLFVTSLNSGSNGNCYYVGNENEAVLIDGGISCRETEKRLKRLELSMKKVKAIFVSHEHGDHIHGVPSLQKKHNLPVYITEKTFHNSHLPLSEKLTFPFQTYTPIRIGNLTILPFPKRHDAVDPHSFIISNESVKVGVFTDIGRSCEHVVKHFQQCHAIFLESNYDEEMLENGRYHISLKNRIRDGYGHLSNKEAAQLLIDHKPPFMTHLFLSHLSKNNNTAKIVHDLFTKIAGNTEVIIAPRDKETKVYQIQNIPGFSDGVIARPKRLRLATQLSLF